MNRCQVKLPLGMPISWILPPTLCHRSASCECTWQVLQSGQPKHAVPVTHEGQPDGSCLLNSARPSPSSCKHLGGMNQEMKFLSLYLSPSPTTITVFQINKTLKEEKWHNNKVQKDSKHYYNIITAMCHQVTTMHWTPYNWVLLQIYYAYNPFSVIAYIWDEKEQLRRDYLHVFNRVYINEWYNNHTEMIEKAFWQCPMASRNDRVHVFVFFF